MTNLDMSTGSVIYVIERTCVGASQSPARAKLAPSELPHILEDAFCAHALGSINKEYGDTIIKKVPHNRGDIIKFAFTVNWLRVLVISSLQSILMSTN